MERSPYVSIIILNYNGADYLEKCLQSVYSTSYPNFEVILVDNASTDGSYKITEKFKRIKLIRNKKNFGYSAGNNIGIDKAQGEYIVLLNNDTIVQPNWLKELIKMAVLGKSFFLQPKILYMDRKEAINSAGNKIFLAGYGVPRGSGKLDRGQYDEPTKISHASGACIFFPKKILKKVGLLDPFYFAYNEDVDWGWRANILGYGSLYVPSAVIYHKGSSVLKWSKGRIYYTERNRIMSCIKNYSRRTLILLLPLFILTELFVSAYCLLEGFLFMKIKAYADLLRLRKYIVRKRKWVQKRRIFSDQESLEYFCDNISHPRFNNYIKPINAIFSFISEKILHVCVP